MSCDPRRVAVRVDATQVWVVFRVEVQNRGATYAAGNRSMDGAAEAIRSKVQIVGHQHVGRDTQREKVVQPVIYVPDLQLIDLGVMPEAVDQQVGVRVPLLDVPELPLKLLGLPGVCKPQLLEGGDVHLPHVIDRPRPIPVGQCLEHLNPLGITHRELLVYKRANSPASLVEFKMLSRVMGLQDCKPIVVISASNNCSRRACVSVTSCSEPPAALPDEDDE
eukprot:CAMPEP_0115767128 /NCGR_PEP_ID=MMETSP0272-20121206/103515_1 /TAXON_ID=71861 /ORGANISM="Scrippsiella trochoidea, Strain CCMP3099" /LENGTH=220 /DNA_ID=CAMNT_0003213135 /DNA_START=399 /DNA_END=1059 /DNA_ORIENTATION=+